MFEAPLAELARAEGLGVLTGKYRSRADVEGRARACRAADMINPRGLRILKALDEVGAQAGASPAQVSLTWLRAKGGTPIASATSVGQLQELAGFEGVRLGAEEMARLNAASAIGPGEAPVRGPMPGIS